MNLSTNIPQKPLPEPEPPKPLRFTREQYVFISTLSEGQHFVIPEEEDENLDKRGVVITQGRSVTRVKFDPRKGEYTYPENISRETMVIPL